MVIPEEPRLGRWRLNDLIDNKKNTSQIYLEQISNELKKFEKSKKFLNDSITIQKFSNIMNLVENISEKLNRVMGHAHLQYCTDTNSNKYSALVTEMELLGTDISNKLLIFDIWFKNILNENVAKKLIQNIDPVYREFLQHKRLMGKYTLSEKEEKLINIFDVTGPGALVKIYDRMTNDFEFVTVIKKNDRIQKKKYDNKEKLMSLVRSEKSEEREAAYKALFTVYKKYSGILGEIYTNLIIQWHDENIKVRGFDSPISVRNMSNDIGDEIINTLLHTCKQNTLIFQKYFKLKAKMLGMKKLTRYHLYAPLVINTKVKKYTYEQAVNLVLNVLESFDPRFREYAALLFTNNHVDSEIRKGKMGGAFCSTITPKITPYVLLNFDGRSRDVSTMAHEFGHAIHSICSKNLPITVSHAPLPLAETASVFAEMLLNEKLVAKAEYSEKSILLAEQIDDMYATIMRQSFFTIFEIEAHNSVTKNNSTIDELSNIYHQNLTKQFGSSMDISEEFQWEWLYIPHFYHTPFYCYAYSFGNLLVLSLFNLYKKEGKSFIPKYLKILSAGGSKKPENLLNEIGINISNRSFWQQGFDLVAEKITQLEKLL
ncbi:MAG: M3 family oligoendopeptidase [Nitrososphaerales archaeon]